MKLALALLVFTPLMAQAQINSGERDEKAAKRSASAQVTVDDHLAIDEYMKNKAFSQERFEFEAYMKKHHTSSVEARRDLAAHWLEAQSNELERELKTADLSDGAFKSNQVHLRDMRHAVFLYSMADLVQSKAPSQVHTSALRDGGNATMVAIKVYDSMRMTGVTVSPAQARKLQARQQAALNSLVGLHDQLGERFQASHDPKERAELAAEMKAMTDVLRSHNHDFVSVAPTSRGQK